jgi:hypothetical protein
MHYHCEIVLPPETADIESAIASVMKPFDEKPSRNIDEDMGRYSFWDFYVIGGRFAGDKQIQMLDQAKLDEFSRWCTEQKITCSGVQCGKQELNPASQIPIVDAKWNELFPQPGNVMVACPLFRHSNDQYADGIAGAIQGDISRLGDSKNIKCNRVIFTGPSYRGGERTGPLEAVFMLTEDEWNGCNHMPVKWDQTLGDALNQYTERLAHYAEQYRNQMQPNDNWICVTVDYHS